MGNLISQVRSLCVGSVFFLFFMGAPAYASESRGLTRGGAESIPEAAAASAEEALVLGVENEKGEEVVADGPDLQVQASNLVGGVVTAPFVSLPVSTWAPHPAGQEWGMYVRTNQSSWTATTNVSWLTVSPSSGRDGDWLVIRAAANNTGSTRTGTVRLHAGSVIFALIVTQAAAAQLPTIEWYVDGALAPRIVDRSLHAQVRISMKTKNANSCSVLRQRSRCDGFSPDIPVTWLPTINMTSHEQTTFFGETGCFWFIATCSNGASSTKSELIIRVRRSQ